jgi:tRNA(Ile)-lysidine synthase
MGGRLDPAVALARRLVGAQLTDLPASSLVLVALSGGADSLALAAATAFVAPRTALRWGAIVVDHDLQESSAAVAARAAEQAEALGAQRVLTKRVTVDTAAGDGPEAAARDARYRALTEAAVAENASAVLLGHTRDDQAETVLLGLARGSGSRSLAGMAPRSGQFRRPLLSMSRQQTAAVCAASGIEPWHDPHNDDPAYTRVRVRRRLLPALEAELGPGVAASLARTADQLRADANLLDRLAADLYASIREPSPTSGAALPVEPLERAAPALRRRVLRLLALDAGAPGGDLSATHVGELDRLVTSWHGQRHLDLPGRLRAERADGVLRVVPVGVGR